MNVCFLCDSAGRDVLYHEIGKGIKKDHYLCFDNKSYQYIKSKVKHNRVYKLNFREFDTIEVNTGYLIYADRKYFNENLWKYWTSIRHTDYKGYINSFKTLQVILWFFETFIKEKNIHMFVSDNIASLPSVVLNQICESNNIEFKLICNSKIPNKSILKRGVDDEYYELNEHYKHSEVDEKRAKEIINEYIDKKQKPIYQTAINKKTKKKSFTLFLKMLCNYYKYDDYKHYRIKKNVFTPFRYLLNKGDEYIKQYLFDTFYPFDEVNKYDNYVLFPLHYQPEASTLVNAPLFTDQITLIHQIAKSLPIQYTLYVKEHNNGYGRRDLDFYKRITQFPNIKIISPKEDIHNLIKKSKLVTIITSTTGFEALLYNKRVITFGNTFINISKNVTHTNDIGKLNSIIKEELNTKFNKEDLYRFISALDKASYECFILMPNQNKKVLNKNNINKIRKMIE